METDFAAAVVLLTVAASIVAFAIAKGFSPIRRVVTNTGGDGLESDGASAADSAIPAAPVDSRSAHSLAHDFFANRRCAICGLAITEPGLLHHPPALRGPDGVTVEWSRFSPSRLVAALKTHEAVCWNCHVAEEFRRMYPDRITERPEHTSAS